MTYPLGILDAKCPPDYEGLGHDVGSAPVTRILLPADLAAEAMCRWPDIKQLPSLIIMIPLTIPWLYPDPTKTPCLDLSSPLPSDVVDVTIMAWSKYRYSWARIWPLSIISSSTTRLYASTSIIVLPRMQDLVTAALSTPKGAGDVPILPPFPSVGVPKQDTKPYLYPKSSGSSPAPNSLTGRRTAWLGSLHIFNFGGKLATLGNI